MKFKIEAIIDLGDDFCDENNKDELAWATRCVKQTNTVFLSDGEGNNSNMDYYPLEIKSSSLVAKGDGEDGRKKPLEFEVAELQNLESCEAQGFTMQDYIDSKKILIDMLKDL